MPRALSNPEWAQFMNDNSALVSSLMPEQSKVVSWDGISVLVYIAPAETDISVGSSLYPNVYLSDVSDDPALPQISSSGYGTAPSQSMLDALPQATLDTIANDAQTTGALVGSAGNVLTKAVGQGASNLLSPTLTPILVGALVILAFAYFPRR